MTFRPRHTDKTRPNAVTARPRPTLNKIKLCSFYVLRHCRCSSHTLFTYGGNFSKSLKPRHRNVRDKNIRSLKKKILYPYYTNVGHFVSFVLRNNILHTRTLTRARLYGPFFCVVVRVMTFMFFVLLAFGVSGGRHFDLI